MTLGTAVTLALLGGVGFVTATIGFWPDHRTSRTHVGMALVVGGLGLTLWIWLLGPPETQVLVPPIALGLIVGLAIIAIDRTANTSGRTR